MPRILKLARLTARVRARRLHLITDELRNLRRPFSRVLDPALFEKKIFEVAEHRLVEEESLSTGDDVHVSHGGYL